MREGCILREEGTKYVKEMALGNVEVIMMIAKKILEPSLLSPSKVYKETIEILQNCIDGRQVQE